MCRGGGGFVRGITISKSAKRELRACSDICEPDMSARASKNRTVSYIGPTLLLNGIPCTIVQHYPEDQRDQYRKCHDRSVVNPMGSLQRPRPGL